MLPASRKCHALIDHGLFGGKCPEQKCCYRLPGTFADSVCFPVAQTPDLLGNTGWEEHGVRACFLECWWWFP